jgi:hypothetical protein
MMVTCSLDKLKILEAERDNWAYIAAELYSRVRFLEQKVVIAEELVKAVSELQRAAEGALAIGEDHDHIL